MPPSRETQVKKAVLFLLTLFLTTPASAKEGQLSSSFSRLLQSGKSLVCTFKKAELSGTSYIAQGKMRGDFGKTQVIHDKEWHYIWGSPFADKKGLKARSSQGGGYLPRGEQAGPDMDETLDFECAPWQPNAARFQPPSDVVFQEAAAPLQRVPDASQEKSARCAACDQAPEGPARVQCRQSLGCA